MRRIEFVDRLLKEENVQIRRDPSPLELKHGGAVWRHVGFAADFEADVIEDQTAQLGGHLSQL